MRIGIADTTFSRVDMASAAIDVLKKNPSIHIERYTVPGMKDLPVACKILAEKYNCDIIIACGWVGSKDIDETCAHEANIGLIQAELMATTHILKVFFHEKETKDTTKQKEIACSRARKHAVNALALLKGKEALTPSAGKGKRQGYNDVGGL